MCGFRLITKCMKMYCQKKQDLVTKAICDKCEEAEGS